jgi:hypothetical protein
MRLAALAAMLLLTGCSGSGFWAYEGNTLTLPGANPNMPVSASENFQRARGGKVPNVQPQLTEAGDIWPGPPQPLPTLKDLQKQQLAETNNPDSRSGLAPLPPLPSLPGYQISEQDIGNPPPPSALGGGSGRHGVYVPPSSALEIGNTSTGNAPIIVPNGNGTSTVISPSGAVSTIPTPKGKDFSSDK